MENQNNSNDFLSGGGQAIGPVTEDTHAPPPDYAALAAPAVPLDRPQIPVGPTPKPIGRFSRLVRRLDVALFVLIILAGTVAFMVATRNQSQQSVASTASNRFGKVDIPLKEVIDGKNLNLASGSSVIVNGPMHLNDQLVLSPSLQPTGAVSGQIYFDKNTKQLAYYNGSEFVFLSKAVQQPAAVTTQTVAVGAVQSIGGSAGQIVLGAGLNLTANQLENSGVLSLQGQTGNIALVAGSGITISGATIASSGVLDVTSSSPNIVVTDDGRGNLTIGGVGIGSVSSTGGTSGTVPLFTDAQAIGNSIITQSGLAVTVSGDLSVTGGVTLTTPLAVGSGGTGASSLTSNGVLLGQGSSAITSVVAGGAGLCLVSTAGAPTFGVCPGSGGVTSVNSQVGALTIANASAATGTITIDNASTTQKGIASFNSTNFVVVGGAVDTIQGISVSATPTFAGLNTNTITPSGAMTVGSTSQTLLLQGSTATITATTGAVTNSLVFETPATIGKTITIPNEAGTICLQGSGNCGFAAASGAGGYIQNQNSSNQTADFRISGTGRANTALQAPLFDTPVAAVLAIGTTNATAINLNQDTTLAAGKSLTVVGGNTASRPASPSEGMMYYDTTTKSLLTYANGKWQSDRTTANKIVAMGTATGCSGSAPVASANPDAADFVSVSCTSAQTVINAAIAALPAGGGTVFLMDGTYIIDGSIALPNNVILVGSGPSTVLKLRDSINGDISVLTNSDTDNGTNITVRDLALDGNRTNNSSGEQNGILFADVGASTNLPGAKINSITASNFRASGAACVFGDPCGNSTISDSSFVNNAGTALSPSGSNMSVVDNSFISNTGTYVLTPGSNAKITGNKFVSNSGVNIYTPGYAVSVTDNLFDGSANNAVYLDNTNNSEISNNTMVNGTDTASTVIAVLGTSANNVVSNNVIYNSASRGITVNGSSNVVSGNRITNGGGSGAADAILVYSSDKNSIMGNIITDTAGGGYAINLNASASNTYISGNTYSGTGASAINDAGTGTIYAGQLDGSGNIMVSGNGNVAMDDVNVSGTLNSNTLTSSGLQFGAAATATVQSSASQALTITSHASATWSTSGGDLTLQGAGALNLKAAGGNIVLGTSDTTGTLLVLDTKTDAGDPTGVEGGVYYNSAWKQLRCYRDGTWNDCSVYPMDRGFSLSDEFLGGDMSTQATQGLIGELGWTAIGVGGGWGANNVFVTPTGSHPGVFAAYTTGQNNGYNFVLNGFYTGSTATNSMELASYDAVKAGVVVDAATGYLEFRVGLHDQIDQDTIPTSGVYWKSHPQGAGSSAYWQYCYVDGGGAEQCANSGVAIVADEFESVGFRINSLGVGTSSVTFTINGNSYTVSGVTVNTNNRVNPVFGGYVTSGASTYNFGIDYYQLSGVASGQR